MLKAFTYFLFLSIFFSCKNEKKDILLNSIELRNVISTRDGCNFREMVYNFSVNDQSLKEYIQENIVSQKGHCDVEFEMYNAFVISSNNDTLGLVLPYQKENDTRVRLITNNILGSSLKEIKLFNKQFLNNINVVIQLDENRYNVFKEECEILYFLDDILIDEQNLNDMNKSLSIR